ncbi:hypothetical protein DPMN_130758 [Dreissena polymorpha]|uniref:Ig-like domain-containing protein n=1 Tax=Dreissena polymorpha TaxID=45954 RepID=A0A9D4H586_DREPO|nr:hypothetical protein DPMN_130758 [Dreissena polymorpha]
MSDIRCSATCYPSCTFIWRKSDILVNHNSVLSLGSLLKGEDRRYACTASNPELNVPTESPIVVIEIRSGPESVSLSPTTLNYTLTEGQVIDNITCSARCSPDACSYTWSKSGTAFVNSFVLSLGSFEIGEAGSYSCTAKNLGSGVTVSSHIVLIEIKEPATRQQTAAIIGGTMGGCVLIIIIVGFLVIRRRYKLICKCVKIASPSDDMDMHYTAYTTKKTDKSEQHAYANQAYSRTTGFENDQQLGIENSQPIYERIGKGI